MAPSCLQLGAYEVTLQRAFIRLRIRPENVVVETLSSGLLSENPNERRFVTSMDATAVFQQ
jgi:hypothetical protein